MMIMNTLQQTTVTIDGTELIVGAHYQMGGVGHVLQLLAPHDGDDILYLKTSEGTIVGIVNQKGIHGCEFTMADDEGQYQAQSENVMWVDGHITATTYLKPASALKLVNA